MKQTIDGVELGKDWCNCYFVTEVKSTQWTEEDLYIYIRVYDEYGRSRLLDAQSRDAAFMHALTTKAGLPYEAKLIAIQLEVRNHKKKRLCAET